MPTSFSFPLDAIYEYEEKHAISFQLTKEQILEGSDLGATRLTNIQLLSVAEQQNQGVSLQTFVKALADSFNPLSFAVFVFNDAVWKLMEKKEESTDTMLPMVSVPGFYWKLSAVTQGNPFGSVRDTFHKSSCIYVPGKTISLMGSGGDFCGIVEAQLADQKTSPRPVLEPHLPGPTNPVPKYEPSDIGVGVSLNDLSVELYTIPQKRMDYTFSEHPKVFYEHGMALITDGINVQLRVSGRKPQNLYGDIWVLLGKRWGPESDPLEIILFHVWLNALHSCLSK